MESVTTTKTPATLATKTPKARRRVRGGAWQYDTANPALAASIDALRVLYDEFERLFDAYTAADAAGLALQQEADVPEASLKAAERASDKADKAQQRALDRVDKATAALLKIPADNLSDAMLKGRAFAWAYGEDGPERLPFDEDGVKVLTALMRDMRGLSSPPPTNPDADLLALAAQFEAAAKAERDYSISEGDAGYDAIRDVTNAIAEKIVLGPRPQTVEGFRAQARVVQHCQSDNPAEPVEFWPDDKVTDTRAAQAVINNLLGVDERPLEEREASARANVEAINATSPRSGPAAKAWFAAAQAFYAAREAQARASDEAWEEAADATAAAMEWWESLPPPDLDALVMVMLASLDFNALDRVWDSTRNPDSWRKLLDGADTHEIFAARFTLHLMRLTARGEHHPALAVVPYSGLYPSCNLHASSKEEEDAGRAATPLRAAREEDLGAWWYTVLSDPNLAASQLVRGADNIRAANRARQLLAAERQPVDEDVIAAHNDAADALAYGIAAQRVRA